jgi:hypothetical protein
VEADIHHRSVVEADKHLSLVVESVQILSLSSHCFLLHSNECK